MERVLLNKVTYLVEKLHWEVLIVTTDQQGRPPFYPFPASVRMIDLGINYSDDNDKRPLGKIAGYLRKRRRHRKALTALLQREKADIVVSLYPSESSFIPDIKDGSKKVLELHYCKFFRLQYGRKGLLGLIDRLRTRQDERIVRRFDKFVVLTHEDCGYWGALNNIEVIPNAALHIAEKRSDVSAQRVIAVGRLDYQKGFDRLIQAWELVQQTNKYGGWRLDIFGQGVLVEAMACGVPTIAFDCKCGPGDIIEDGVNGLLVKDGDIEGLAAAMTRLMSDGAYRRELSANARKVTDTYSKEAVMALWLNLFTSLTEK